VLADLASLERQHPGEERGHAASVIAVMAEADAHDALRELERRGLVRRGEGDLWSLTPRGREEAGR
jgi:Mn-dependent DtxR family transcriptional regulator